MTETKEKTVSPAEPELPPENEPERRKMIRGERDLTRGGIVSTLVTFAIPFFIANLLQALYGAVDLLIVSRFSAGNAVAAGVAGAADVSNIAEIAAETNMADASAVACGSQIITIIFMGVTGLTIAGTVIIGRYFGNREYEKVTRTVGTMLSTFMICTVFITALMFWLSPCLLRLLHTPPDAFENANEYVRICSAGTIFIFGYNGFSAILRGVGNSVSPMIFVGIACLCNIIFDLLLVGEFGMGPTGAAIATVGSQALSMCFAIVYIKRMGTLFDFRFRSFAIDPQIVKKLFIIGLPLSIQATIIDFSFILIFSIVNQLGVAASAGYGISCRINGFTMLFSISFAMALTAIVAQNLGAGKTERALSFLKASVSLSGAIAILLFLWMEFAPQTAFRLFTEDPETIAAGSLFMKGFCFDILLVAFVFSGNGFLNGSGHTRFTLVNNVVPTFLIRVPAAWLISIQPWANLFWVGTAAPFASVLSVIVTLIYLKTGRWKIKRV